MVSGQSGIRVPWVSSASIYVQMRASCAAFSGDGFMKRFRPDWRRFIDGLICRFLVIVAYVVYWYLMLYILFSAMAGRGV